MRIAFLTTQYPSEMPDAGGLATYVHRMARSLQEFGHEPEVFVLTEGKSEVITYDSVCVHRVGHDRKPRLLRQMIEIGRRRLPALGWNSAGGLLDAYRLARAFEKRHDLLPFELVQSTNLQAAGLFVSKRCGRTHVIRCSESLALYSQFHHNRLRVPIVGTYLEKLAMRRADLIYAPSQWLADYFKNVIEKDVFVVRPPMHVGSTSRLPVSFDLPERFFIHFGMLGERKGSSLLAKALTLAWESAPDLTMVWSGVCWPQLQLRQWRAQWGERAKQVIYTGPLPRAQLLAVLDKAEVAVLPSLADNLPNTVIESLSLGVPVVGSRGASIDELVEDGITGYLVELGDAQRLAYVLVEVWNNRLPALKGFKWTSKIASEMTPEAAVSNLLRLCKV